MRHAPLNHQDQSSQMGIRWRFVGSRMLSMPLSQPATLIYVSTDPTNGTFGLHRWVGDTREQQVLFAQSLGAHRR